MDKGQAVCWKHNAGDNSISRSNQNSIPDTLLYEVEFPGGEIIEKAA